MEKTIHHGRNIRRFREMLSLKQDALAHELGTDWNQKKVSLLEAKEQVEEKLLAEVAAVLKVPVEAIKNFDEEQAVQIISNTFHDSSVLNGNGINYYPSFNPLDKYVEMVEKNERLYEALLVAERGRVELLERMVDLKRSQ